MAQRRTPQTPPDAPRRKSHGFRQAAGSLTGPLKAVAGRQGFAESDVLLRWPEIVGAELCTHCRPVKVSYSASRQLGATLIVQTDGGHAPQVEMQAPTIVDRVNRFYGYRAVSRLKVTQSTGLGAAQGFAESATPFGGPATEPSPQDVKRAETMTRDIESPGLRAAITQMGAHVLAKGRTGRRPDNE